MRILKFALFESIDEPTVTIEEFVDALKNPIQSQWQRIAPISDQMAEKTIEVWNKTRSDINIHYFGFDTNEQIAGGIVSEDAVAINAKLPMPAEHKLFLLFHESRHIDQVRAGEFMDGYFNTVVNAKKNEFLRNYVRLEKDANDFALEKMGEIVGQNKLGQFQMMRFNENAGPMVYDMMSADIKSYNAKDFFELIKKQIL